MQKSRREMVPVRIVHLLLGVALVVLLAACPSSPTPAAVKPLSRFAFVIAGAAIETYLVHTDELAQGPGWRPVGQVGDLRPLRYIVPSVQPKRLVPIPAIGVAVLLTTDGQLATYRLNASTGELTLLKDKAAPSALHPAVQDITVSPDSRHLIAVRGRSASPFVKDGLVASYSIDQASGALSQSSSATAGKNPQRVTVEPGGQTAYVVNRDGVGSVHAFSIDANSGKLSPVGSTYPANQPSAIAADPAGRFVYVSEDDGGNPAGWTISVLRRGTDGSLTKVSAIPTPGEPRGITVHPSGKFVYASGPLCLCVYTLDTANEALTGPNQQLAGGSVTVAVDDRGAFLYAPGRPDMGVMSIDPSTGHLSRVANVRGVAASSAVALTSGEAPVRQQPRLLLTAHPTRNVLASRPILRNTGLPGDVNSSPTIVDPSALATDNEGRHLYVASRAAKAVTSYGIDAEGKLTLIGTLSMAPTTPTSVAVDPSGRELLIGVEGPGIGLVAIAMRNEVTGAITLNPASVVSVGACTPAQLLADPAGHLAFVRCVSGGVTTLIREPTATFTVKDHMPDPASALAIDAAGRNAYLIDTVKNTVSSYTINDSITPSLSAPTTTATGTAPIAVVVDPLGRWAYTINQGSHSISKFDIRDTSLANGVGWDLPSTLANPTAAVIDPSGHWMLVTHDRDGSIFTFSLDQETGNPTDLGQPTTTSPVGSGIPSLTYTTSIE